MHWTDEQKRAIETRGTNILLSAAAGSGKTTVLVERVLQMIQSGETRIDRMLIVTFTRAASADMRAKLSHALGARAAQGDELCRSQQLLMERASISTLHGFCSDFLRTHFETAGVDPAFRVLDDAETRRITDEALDQAIEEAYENPDDRLWALDYARGPKGVRAMAEILLKVLDERPDPQAWLESVCSPDDAMRSAWIDELTSAARREIDRALLLCRLAISHPECTANYAAALEQDVQALLQLRASENYSDFYRGLMEFKQARPKTQRGVTPDDEVKKLRQDAKSALEKISLREIELGTALKDVQALIQEYAALGEITLRARAILEDRKNELSGLSYSDLEHRTLRALQDEDTARELRERYDHIFVDEYQDTSDVQEALVKRICRGSNLFMVGDVKQSIYRFRQAEPRLFLKKYNAYGEGCGGLLLPLTMNFRSRPAILNFTNHIFGRAMFGGESEIIYDELARLNHGNKTLEGGDVQIHLLENPDALTADEELMEMKACEREALFIAEEIRRRMQENPQLKYQDFAILTRTKRGVLGRMATILLQQGIPAFADGSEAYYDSIEVSLALSLLKLTANRRSDVELIGVLRSPVVGLSADQLAQIRIFRPDVPYCDAAAAYADEAGDDTARQLRAFFGMMEKWQLQALCTDLGVLCRSIFDESGLFDCMGALPGGPQRQANLNQLVCAAARFDQNVSGALTRFLKHTEKLKERGDGDEAHLLGENDDVVRLMTVHKSKGLEFPIVFGAMMSRRYNNRASSEALSAQRDLGLGCLYCDPELQTRRKTLPQAAIAERSRREDRAEELRILYVLLTRARDSLVLLGSIKDAESARARWTAMQETPSAAGSYLDVIMPALDENGSGICSIHLHGAPEISAVPKAMPEEDAFSEEPVDEDLLRALLWQYPAEKASRQPLKLTVTGLLRELQAPEALEPLIERPAFLTESSGRMTGVERGTAYHRAMQCLNLQPLVSLQGRALTAAIAAQLDLLCASGRISTVQREAIRPGMIARFLESETGRRMLNSDEIQREWPFNALMRISEALEPEESGDFADEEIMVQGTIDCCFLENGRWVLLDYKTDRADDAEALTLRYRNQLRLYALALERITGMPVAEIRLCLLLAGETLAVPLHEKNDANVPW